ncbi:MAG: leucine-rich repeat protein [Eubacteriales bacterium]
MLFPLDFEVTIYINFYNKYIAEFLNENIEYFTIDEIENENREDDEMIIKIEDSHVEIRAPYWYRNNLLFGSYSIEETMVYCLLGDASIGASDISRIRERLYELLLQKKVRDAFTNFSFIKKCYASFEIFNVSIGEISGGSISKYGFGDKIIEDSIYNYNEECIFEMKNGVLNFFLDPCPEDKDSGYSIGEDYVLPDTIESIGENAFNCSASEIELPMHLISIGANAFSNCKMLLRIQIPTTTIEIHKTAFEGIKSQVIIVATENSYASEYANLNGIQLEVTTAEKA